MMLNNKIIGIFAGVMAFTGCRTTDSGNSNTSEVQVEGPSADVDAILEVQTYNGAKVIAYRPCIGIGIDDVDAANQTCSRLTAGSPMIMILEADFLPQLAEDMGVDFAAYQAKEIKDKTGNEAKLAEIERALATTRLLDGQRLKELVGNVDVMRYFRHGLMFGNANNADIYDTVTRNRWFAPSVSGTLGVLLDGCTKSRYTIATREILEDNIEWLASEKFLIDIADGKPVYGNSKFWDRLKGSKVPEKYKAEVGSAAEMAIWVGGQGQHMNKKLYFPATTILLNSVGESFLVAANATLERYDEDEVTKLLRDYAYVTDAQMGGLCFFTKKKLKIGMSFYTKEKDVIKVSSTQYDTPARRAGVLAGDTIVSIEGRSIKSFQDFVDMTVQWPTNIPLPIKVRRNGTDMIINFDLSK